MNINPSGLSGNQRILGSEIQKIQFLNRSKLFLQKLQTHLKKKGLIYYLNIGNFPFMLLPQNPILANQVYQLGGITMGGNFYQRGCTSIMC